MKKHRNSLKSGFILNNYIINYYKLLNKAKEENKLTASVSLGFPTEILYAMDILPIYAQEHSAMYGPAGKAQSVLEKVEGKGFLPDICSEVKISFGALFYDMQLNFNLPRPDIVLAASNICKSMPHFSEQISDYFHLPYYLIDFPPMAGFESKKHHIEYIIIQLKELIVFLEKISNKKFDYDKLYTIMMSSQKALELWQEIINFGTFIPSPINALDLYFHMFAFSVFRGTREAIEYYKILRREIYQRIVEKVPAVIDEKYRLLWDFMPVFHKTNFLSRICSRRKVSFVTSTYFFTAFDDLCKLGICHVDEDYKDKPDELLKILAENYIRLYMNLDITQRMRILTNLIERYSINGIVFHANHSCKPQSIIQPQMKNMIENQAGIPCLVLDADSSDPRYFSDSQIVTRIEAFLELL